jgi:hypothetical protein
MFTALHEVGMNADFWEMVCDFRPVLRILFALLVVLLLLQVVASPFVEPGTGAYQIFLTNFVVLLPVTLAVAYLLRRCRTHRPD